MMFLLRSMLLSLLLLPAAGSLAQAGFFNDNQDDFLPVEEAYQLSIEFDEEKLWLVWQVADEYYLYRHGFAHQWMINGNEPFAVEVDLPKGVDRHDEYFGDVEVYYQQAVIELPLPDGADNADELVLRASSQGCADAGLCYPPFHQYFHIDLEQQTASLIESPSATRSQASSAEVADQADYSLLLILLGAFLGGLILNLMPCVFPVLGIKAMQLIRHQNSAVMRLHGLVYMAGVIVSFLLIAALMLGLRSAGSLVGWGFQLQNPWFVASLVYLFVLLALNMAGMLQFGLRWMGIGQSLTEKGGLSASFFTGVLAVVVASPCTAPFMGAALGYAVMQPAPLALLIFAVLGLGMAAPLTLLSFVPRLAGVLPRPGAWMDRLKQFFAFPLLLTALWLLWVLGNQTSTVGMSMILLGCIGLLFAFWCFRGGMVSRALGLIALLFALSLPFSGHLAPVSKQPSHDVMAFTEQGLADLRRQGVPVFVDLTADWCITCKANERTTLHTAEVQEALAEAGIVYMVGDWTNYNPEITALLERHQRSGIPLYLLYPPEPNAPPLILPQLLSKRIVLDAISNL